MNNVMLKKMFQKTSKRYVRILLNIYQSLKYLIKKIKTYFEAVITQRDYDFYPIDICLCCGYIFGIFFHRKNKYPIIGCNQLGGRKAICCLYVKEEHKCEIKNIKYPATPFNCPVVKKLEQNFDEIRENMIGIISYNAIKQGGLVLSKDWWGFYQITSKDVSDWLNRDFFVRELSVYETMALLPEDEEERSKKIERCEEKITAFLEKHPEQKIS